MTVKELKAMLRKLPDEMQVICPLNAAEGFDGMFFSPCLKESGEADLGINEEDANKDEIEEIISPSETEKSFVLVPCGFFNTNHEREKIELN